MFPMLTTVFSSHSPQSKARAKKDLLRKVENGDPATISLLAGGLRSEMLQVVLEITKWKDMPLYERLLTGEKEAASEAFKNYRKTVTFPGTWVVHLDTGVTIDEFKSALSDYITNSRKNVIFSIIRQEVYNCEHTREDLEDIMMSSVISLINYIYNLDGINYIDAYISRTVVREAQKFAISKRKSKETSTTNLSDSDKVRTDNEVAPEPRVVDKNELEHSFLQFVTKDEFDLIWEYYCLGRAYAEMAQERHTTVNALRQRNSRALKKIPISRDSAAALFGDR